MYSACIFDLDGTLANTLRSIAGFGNAALKSFGLKEIPEEEYKMLVGNGADMLIRRMAERSNAHLNEGELKKLRLEYDRLYESEPMKLVEAYDGIEELLVSAREKGLKLGVVSNKPDNMTKYIVASLYPDLFDDAVGQREGVPKKPDPTAVLNIARRWSLKPESILYIGDSGVDMQTAENAGMTSCGVLWGFRGKAELLRCGAKNLAENAEELGRIIGL